MRKCLTAQILCNEARRISSVHTCHMQEKNPSSESILKYSEWIQNSSRENRDASENLFFSPTPSVMGPFLHIWPGHQDSHSSHEPALARLQSDDLGIWSIVTSVAEDLECSYWSLLKLQYLMWHTQVLQNCCNDSRKTLGMTNLDAKINIELNECLKPSQRAVVSPFPHSVMKFRYKELCSVSAQQFRIGGFHRGTHRYLLIFHATSVDSLRLSESAQPLQPGGFYWLELSCACFFH